jgi:F0F1-type ATP synthase membrane subunit c/vacuolar-type H+-ATPase subunit K
MSLGLDEEKGKEIAGEREVDAIYRVLRFIWLAILASLIVIFVVTRIIKPEPGAPKELFWVLLAVGVGNFGASFFLKQKILKQAAEKRKPEMVKGAYLAGLALCESIGLFGLVAHLMTGVEYYYFFFVLSGFGILLHKPQRDDILAAFNGGGIWEARRND